MNMPIVHNSTGDAHGGRLRIAIALCTCNGASFLQSQLDSFLGQSHLPDQLVVCDDASEDSTLAILEAFAARAPFPVRLYRNMQRLGVNDNFAQAIGLCQEEVIVLADQDDVWVPGKLEYFAQALASEEIGWAFCDAEVVDAELRPLGYTLWQRVAFTPGERRLAAEAGMFPVLLKHYVVAGATMAFRAELREYLLPIPPSWPYDAWLAAVAAAVTPCGLIEKSLQRYRQHGANVVGGRRKGVIRQVREGLRVERGRYYGEELACWRRLAERLEAVQARAAAQEALAAKLTHLERRAGLPDWRVLRLPGIAAELLSGGYRRYARNWGSVALDLLFR